MSYHYRTPQEQRQRAWFWRGYGLFTVSLVGLIVWWVCS